LSYNNKTNPACTALGHGGKRSYERGCECPEALDAYRTFKERQREYNRKYNRDVLGKGEARYLPEDGIVDEIAVEIFMSQERKVRVTERERDLAIVGLAARGWSGASIVDHTGVSERIVANILTAPGDVA